MTTEPNCVQYTLVDTCDVGSAEPASEKEEVSPGYTNTHMYAQLATSGNLGITGALGPGGEGWTGGGH